MDKRNIKCYYLLFFFFSDNEIKIISLNVRGLGNSTKRREIFNWLRAKKNVDLHVTRSSLFC